MVGGSWLRRQDLMTEKGITGKEGNKGNSLKPWHKKAQEGGTEDSGAHRQEGRGDGG